MPKRLTPNQSELTAKGLTDEEAIDTAPTESAPYRPPIRARAVATAHVYAVHPDTGLDVVFVPGETLPEWASEQEH